MWRRGAVLIALGTALAGTIPAAAAKTSSIGTQRVVVLALHHRAAALDAFVAEVSNPLSAQYRHYLTIEQLARRFGASRSVQRVVNKWLAANRLRGRLDPTHTFLEVTMTSATTRRLLPRIATSRPARAASAAPPAPGADLRVPAELASAVTGIVDGSAPLPSRPADGSLRSRTIAAARSTLPPFNPQGSSVRQRTGTPAGCPSGQSAGPAAGVARGFAGLTPIQYLTAYGFPRLIKQDLRGTSERIAVVEFGGFTPGDITTFTRCFGLPTPKLRVTPIDLRRPLAPLDETTLDLEVLAAAAPKARAIDVYEAAPTSMSGLIDMTAAPLTDRTRRPNVESISYGICEPLLSGGVVVARTINSILEFEAAAGISVLASAGDTGSSGCAYGSNSGAVPVPSVQYPASSPYITAVGGLNFTLTDSNEISQELVWNHNPLGFGAGGGGVSLLFGHPSWQPHSGPASATRMVPDVSMLADSTPGYAIYCSPPACAAIPSLDTPGWLPVGGTSAAAPLLAGGIADADQEAARHHQPPLGFVNPLLYESAQRRGAHVIRDVTIGGNDLGTLEFFKTPIGCCAAKRGYDLASGLGSVNVDYLSRFARRAAFRKRHRG